MNTLSPQSQSSIVPRADVPFAALRRFLPPSQVLRYLIVGVWNTIFGYILYAGFVYLYSHFLPHRYLPLFLSSPFFSSLHQIIYFHIILSYFIFNFSMIYIFLFFYFFFYL